MGAKKGRCAPPVSRRKDRLAGAHRRLEISLYVQERLSPAPAVNYGRRSPSVAVVNGN
jgi:hypothetical protein